jgi:hypothetical protein
VDRETQRRISKFLDFRWSAGDAGGEALDKVTAPLQPPSDHSPLTTDPTTDH